ncbi:hypothetical protein [Corynebacterium bovis]|uniref:Uncharacterized protein n=1 Tax=Corynebacterium bovis DSM 20582 = CIP 54.80 TaxID=927655 RepID=A0A8H9Y8E3_9CORY|nr:hypothetical protein [Corynebacterium bovis]MBB3115960.1 hypothetical protein [Corynebacterium bovis DSM 20582 = CIP 54.80]MDK8511293.1 hypothetical protein [Corynebacterium bovis]QQC46913.1 hypothetical protein I6I09_07330 [Corynebacterium bovis]
MEHRFRSPRRALTLTASVNGSELAPGPPASVFPINSELNMDSQSSAGA